MSKKKSSAYSSATINSMIIAYESMKRDYYESVFEEERRCTEIKYTFVYIFISVMRNVMNGE